MHLIDTPHTRELRQLQRWYANGQIDAEEFAALYRDLERTGATLCDNGDSRIALQVRNGRNLCAACLMREGRDV